MTRTLLAAALLVACAAAPAPSRPARPNPQETARQRAAGFVERAHALRAAGNLAGAEGWLEAALAVVPDDRAARLDLADLLVADARSPERAASLIEGLPDPDAAKQVVLGRLAELREDPPAAEAAYQRALALRDDPEVRLHRALALERLGREAEATAELEQVRAARPDDAVARSRLAQRYEAAGRAAEAEAELRWLAEASAGRPEGWRRLAALLTRAGQAEKAKAAEAKAREAEAKVREAERGTKRSLRSLPPSSR